jgi:hypothetical protein
MGRISIGKKMMLDYSSSFLSGNTSFVAMSPASGRGRTHLNTSKLCLMRKKSSSVVPAEGRGAMDMRCL